MAIKYAVPWTRQPPGPQKVADRWRSRVVSAWYPLSCCDVVRGDRLTINGSAAYHFFAGDKFFGHLSGSSTADYADLGVLSTLTDNTRISSLLIATPDSVTTRMSLFDTSNDSSSTASHLGYSHNAGYTTASKPFCYGGTNFTGEGTAGYFVSGQRSVFGSSYSKTSPTNTVSFYKNGYLWNTGSFDTAPNVNAGTYPYCIGGRKTAASHTSLWDGSIELHVLFQPVLSAPEFAELSARPWALFEPMWVRRYFFGPTAGASAGNRPGGWVAC